MKRSYLVLAVLVFVAAALPGYALSGEVWSEVKDNVAYVHHDDAWFNCCPDSIFDIQRHADTIDIYEIDNGSHPCLCMCYFDFTHRIEGLEPGTYLARVWEKYPGEEPKLAGETSFAIPVLVGAFDIVHHMSPCHEEPGVSEEPASAISLESRPLIQQSAEISFSLRERADVKLEIYDVQGRRVRTLETGFLEAGEHTAVWDTRTDSGVQVSRGIYFVRLVVGSVSEILPLIVLK